MIRDTEIEAGVDELIAPRLMAGFAPEELMSGSSSITGSMPSCRVGERSTFTLA